MTPAIPFSLYLITDRHVVPGGDLLAAVERALAGGVEAVQLREKDLPAAEFLHLARQLRSLTSRYHARLLINRRLDVARAVAADGLHLGPDPPALLEARRQLGPRALLGVSTHDLTELRRAATAGADFATFGPIWHTPAKAPFGEPVGTPQLAAACVAGALPVFALGGVTPDRVPQLRTAGAAGAAAIAALLAVADPTRAAQQFRAALDAAPPSISSSGSLPPC
ncbi:thiamine phosphate synthase [Desulfuromonas carbonis]|uniref:thiamine phosphate synthase n=1 Tax=Desulfuromonas sp. DDH964 TaxID=1823759 RepID=UPI00078EF4B9|nr:thiamine phosphate synthase [Desulfuromonas sp. DDH964]AMV71424.1 carboxythiazole phosphate tautomerase [Desulfuromonas sp. DDH964]